MPSPEQNINRLDELEMLEDLADSGVYSPDRIVEIFNDFYDREDEIPEYPDES